jgi:aminoglycoside N3'-acetyltransferase
MNLKNIIWRWIKNKYKIRSKENLINKYRRIIGKKIYKKKYKTEDIILILRKIGLKKNSNVFIHSSWDEFYNYNGGINDFIDSILNEIGPGGTLAMPSYPFLRSDNSIFDLKKTPTQAGIIAETFRKYPGVKRSINRHSVCCIGPMSDFLLSEHKNSVTSWDEKSPYYKLAEIEATVITLGLGKYFVGTIMHCADSVLRETVPYFEQFFSKEATYKYRLEDQSIYEQRCLTAADNFRYKFTNRSHGNIIKKYFDKNKYMKFKLSNLTINSYDAKYFIHRSIELGKEGIVVYTKPKPIKIYNNQNN